MDGGGIFRVRTDARTRLGIEMGDIMLHNNELGGYAYNDAQICVTQIERVLERHMFEDSVDGMKGLASKPPNSLSKMKSTVSTRCADILR